MFPLHNIMARTETEKAQRGSDICPVLSIFAVLMKKLYDLSNHLCTIKTELPGQVTFAIHF